MKRTVGRPRIVRPEVEKPPVKPYKPWTVYSQAEARRWRIKALKQEKELHEQDTQIVQLEQTVAQLKEMVELLRDCAQKETFVVGDRDGQ